MGGDRTLARAGLPDHYLLPAYEIAAGLHELIPEDISRNPLLRYQLVDQADPKELSTEAHRIVTAQNLSHLAITGCTNQDQISALREIFSGSRFHSVWLDTPPRSVYEAFLRRAKITGITCPMTISKILKTADEKGMNEIRINAGVALQYRDPLGADTPRLVRRALDEAAQLAA